MTLDEIKQPVAQPMSNFEPFFRKQLNSPNALLTVVVNYLLRKKGKQMRPMLTFLAAQATGTITEATYATATLIELLHTATLVHDDVVDETYQRRGQFSVNAIWNSKVSVLVGDLFLARGLQTAMQTNQFEVLRIVADAVGEISEGELSQIEHARKLDITEATYFDVIRKKTATLIAACTKAGALSSGASQEHIEALYNYGLNLGIAFQIRDDIFDYEKSSLIGKPSGNDIKERKITLPLISALHQAPNAESKQMMHLIASHYKDDATARQATEFVHKYGGIEYSTNIMTQYALKAKQCLDCVPSSAAKESLIAMVEYNTTRKK